MSRRTLLALALLAALVPAARAQAAAPPAIGIGEQKASMFDDHRWQRLGLRDVRYVAPWDALRDPRQRALLDAWMAAARKADARVLLGFAHSQRSRKHARRLPRPSQFARQFRRFRARYPDVRNWIVWNEANHPGGLTAQRPRRAARYFDAVARKCAGCRIVAADVLDVRGMASWVRRFARHARHRPRIWGLHNYTDTNGLRTDRTLELLRATRRGQVWFTETGGLVLRRDYRGRRVLREHGYSLRHAARSTIHAIRLAALSRRIRRIYLYHWRAPWTVTGWDSAFIGPRGETRRAYRALVRELRRMR
jgi:hypothetical protein